MNCPICQGEMWDNRLKKTNPKAPDFKCKDANCTGVIWPPKTQAVANPNYTPKIQERVEEIREKLAPDPQEAKDAENRGKVRHGIVVAQIEHGGLQSFDERDKAVINDLVEFIMTGK